MRIFDFIKKKLFKEVYSDDIDFISFHPGKLYKPSFNPITGNWYFFCFSKVVENKFQKSFENLIKRTPKLNNSLGSMEQDLMNEPNRELEIS